MVARDVDLEPIFARVARARQQHPHAGQLGPGHMKRRRQHNACTNDLLHDAHGLRALNRNLRPSIGVVRHFGLAANLRPNPIGILVTVGGVHADEPLLLAEPCHDEVVHDAAIGATHRGVERLAYRERRTAVGDEAVHGRSGAGAAHEDLAHVAHVEDAGGLPHGMVLVHDARVPHRHLEAGEGGKAGAGSHMAVVEREAGRGGRRHGASLRVAVTKGSRPEQPVEACRGGGGAWRRRGCSRGAWRRSWGRRHLARA